MNKKKFIFIIFFSVCSLGLNAQTLLTVRGFSEGFYRGSTGRMVAIIDSVQYPLLCDTAIVSLIDTTTLQPVLCQAVLISTEGYGICNVPSTLNGQYLFVSLKFRNTFHLLSADPVLFTGNPGVDLTQPQNVCCSFEMSNGIAKAFSGDVYIDGFMDGVDYLTVDMDRAAGVSGYALTDLDGNRIVNDDDVTIVNHNIQLGYADGYFNICTPTINGISEREFLPVKIYPNPCVNYFQIDFGKTYSNFRVTMYNELGEICMNDIFRDESVIKINCSRLPSGLYKILMTDGNLFFSKSLVVSKTGR